MPPKKNRPIRKRTQAKTSVSPRDVERRMLARSLRTERLIQSTTKQLKRAILKSNNALQSLAAELSSRARALEAERDVDASLNT